MNEDQNKKVLSLEHPIWSSLFFFGFGIALLLFLVAVEDKRGSPMKSMSGTAAAVPYGVDKIDKWRS